MRKIFLMSCLMAMSAIVMAQQASPKVTIKNPATPGRDYIFACPEGSVCSQVSQDLSNLYFCQQGDPWYIAADPYTASGPFASIRFWGTDLWGCTMAASEPFIIYIWDGDPSAGGNLINTFNVMATITDIPFDPWNGQAFYQIEAELGTTVNQLTGYIGITRTSATCLPYDEYYGGFTCIAYAGGNTLSYSDEWGWFAGEDSLLICLGAGTPTNVPITNWALYIGIGLILVFAVVRFRKMV